MKKILIAAILLTAGAMAVHAQYAKGAVMLGVSSSLNLVSSGSGPGGQIMTLGFSNISHTEGFDGNDFTNESKASHINFTPRGGYFIIDNLAAGAGINFGRSALTEDVDGEYTETQTLVAFEPFVRYYYPLSSIAPFCEIKGALGSINDKIESDGSDPFENKHRLSSFGVGVGASIPVGMNASFDVIAGYNLINTKYEEDLYKVTNKIGTIGIEFGFRVFIGGYGSSADASY
ncbi:MAG: outer membrane beta-barrel protein [Marinilabiliaceae bacterium]|jgi:hypothetical protein|nr:outer membrane beta-barrel protein [Marinilabiliaceae bacterium]